MGCSSSDCCNMGSELCPSVPKLVSSISSHFKIFGNAGLHERCAGALKRDLTPNSIIEEPLDCPSMTGGW